MYLASRRRSQWRLIIAVSSMAGVMLVLFWPRLPEHPELAPSHALDAAEARDTQLGRTLAGPIESHPDQSGIQPLYGPLDAFAARNLLTQAAERTLDIQYYIWGDDLTGTLMLSALLEAADRGVSTQSRNVPFSPK